MVAEDSANLQRGRITGRIAGHAGFPGVQVGADQQKFITAAIAVQNCCGLVDDAPGAIGDGMPSRPAALLGTVALGILAER